MKQLILILMLLMILILSLLMYQTKLLEDTVADGKNRFLRSRTIAVSLKYLSSFWRSLEMPLVNCKVELKHKWTKCCVLSVATLDSTNANTNDIIFTFKDTKLYGPVLLSKTLKVS